MTSADGNNNHNTSTLITSDGEFLISLNNDQTQVHTPLLPIRTVNDISVLLTNAQSSDHPHLCRLCHCQGTDNDPLISPCDCSGTMQYLHQSCLQDSIKTTGVQSCELCKCKYIVQVETKPLKRWRKLNMNAGEICQVVGSVVCSLIGGVWLSWWLYVMIEKSKDEIRAGRNKSIILTLLTSELIVAIICFCGGLGCLLLPFKTFIKLCIRWHRCNQRLIIRSRQDDKLPSKMTYSNTNQDDCIVILPDGYDSICNLE